jgi:hypothetical protein
VLALALLVVVLPVAVGTPAAFGKDNDDTPRTPTPTKTVTALPSKTVTARPPENRGDLCRAPSALKLAECRKLEVRGLKPSVGMAGTRLPVEIVGKGFDPDLKAALVELLPATTPPLTARLAERVDLDALSNSGPGKPGELPRPPLPSGPDGGPKGLPAPTAPTYPIEILQVTPEKAVGLLPAVPAGRYGLLVTSGGERDYTAPAYLAVSDAPQIERIQPPVAANERPTDLKIDGFNFKTGLTVTIQLAFTLPITASPPITPTEPVSTSAQSVARPPLPPLPSPLVPVTGPAIVLTDGLKVEPRQIKVVVPAGLPVGIYQLTVTNPDGKSDSALPGLMVVGPRVGDDLVAGEIWTDPLTVRVDEDVRLGVRVKRIGGKATLTGVKVTFYLGRPETGTPIGTATLEPLEPNGAANASIIWNTTGLSGTVGVSALVDPANEVPELTELNNVAGRMIRVLPPSDGDVVPPKVTGVEIDGGATSSADRAVTLTVQAADVGSGLNSLLVVEKIFLSSIREWTTVRVSDWMTFSPSITYTLSADAGVHHLSVFVSDNAGNISRPMSDWVNYLPLTDTVRAGQVKVFRQDLSAGQTLSVTLTTLAGDADLYLFGPGGRLGFSINPTTTVDSLVFTAEREGRYLIEVEGFVASTYSLSWTVTTGGSSALAFREAAVVPAGKIVREASVSYDIPPPDASFDAITADTRPAAVTTNGLYIPATSINAGS